MKLIFNPGKGWFFAFSMLTGSKDLRGNWYPTVAHGRALPPVMNYKIGPFESASAAKAACA